MYVVLKSPYSQWKDESDMNIRLHLICLLHEHTETEEKGTLNRAVRDWRVASYTGDV